MIRLCSKKSVGRVEPWVCLVAMMLLFRCWDSRKIAAGMLAVMAKEESVT